MIKFVKLPSDVLHCAVSALHHTATHAYRGKPYCRFCKQEIEKGKLTKEQVEYEIQLLRDERELSP